MNPRWLATVSLCIGMAFGDVAAAQAASPAEAGAEAAPEIICKRFAEPGSLVRKRKICLTRMEWSAVSEAAQRNVEQLQFNNMGGPEGCRPGTPGC